jgi:hypothetical protein
MNTFIVDKKKVSHYVFFHIYRSEKMNQSAGLIGGRPNCQGFFFETTAFYTTRGKGAFKKAATAQR